MSWAWVLVKPIAFVMVGMVNLMPVMRVSPGVFESDKRITIGASGLAEQDVRQHVHSPVQQHGFDISPRGSLPLLLEVATLFDKMLQLQVPNLLGVKPLPRSPGRVDQKEEAHYSQDDSDNSLKKEDPPPALLASHAIHLRNTGCQKAGESARQRTGTVENSDTGGKVLWHVPDGA